MTLAVFSFVAAAILLCIGVILREYEVPEEGSIGRGPRAQILSMLLTVAVVVAATLTFSRLIALSG